jgi:mannose-6-phosphate isomerase-like protein (cupin superfamily)
MSMREPIDERGQTTSERQPERLSGMETVNGCTVIPASDDSDPTRFGPTEAGGAYFALIGLFSPGEPGPPVHVHPTTDEAFYVASGEATFLLGDREVRMTAGSLVFIPRGVQHTVWNAGSDPVRGLLVISPGDREHVFVPIENS